MLSNSGHAQLPNAVVSMVCRLESTDVDLHRKKNILGKLT